MAEWITVAQGESAEEFENATPAIDDIPAGSEIRCVIDINMLAYKLFNPNMWNPFRGAFDLDYDDNQANADWWAAQLALAQMKVTSVIASDDGHIEISGIAEGSPAVAVIIVIAAVIGVLGVAWAVQRILVEYYKTEQQAANIALTESLASQGYSAAEIATILGEVNAVPATQGDTSLFGLGDISKYLLPAALILGGVYLIGKKI